MKKWTKTLLVVLMMLFLCGIASAGKPNLPYEGSEPPGATKPEEHRFKLELQGDRAAEEMLKRMREIWGTGPFALRPPSVVFATLEMVCTESYLPIEETTLWWNCNEEFTFMPGVDDPIIGHGTCDDTQSCQSSADDACRNNKACSGTNCKAINLKTAALKDGGRNCTFECPDGRQGFIICNAATMARVWFDVWKRAA